MGGELFTVLRKKKYFKPPTARFYAACVLEAFHHMHQQGIAYRDLKPENIMIDRTGYGKITDMGFAKRIGFTDKSFTLCGTPDYLAPEIITGQGHTTACDWWAFGVLCYEMMASFPPFYADNQMATFKKAVKRKMKWPQFFDAVTKDFVGNFLRVKPAKRSGVKSGGTDAIREHPFFDEFDWDALRAGTMPAPIEISKEFAKKNFSQPSREEKAEAENAQIITPRQDEAFANFTSMSFSSVPSQL